MHDGDADRVCLWRARAGVRERVWGRMCRAHVCVRSTTAPPLRQEQNDGGSFGQNAGTKMSLFLED